jgi:serine O-acetyltransferase
VNVDDRGYLAQALFERLGGEGSSYRVLGDPDAYPERPPALVQVAVPRHALAGIPRIVARFCHEMDLQLVELETWDPRAWRCVLAWSDEVGRPRFMRVRVSSDYCRGMRCYLRAEELLAASPEVLFSHGLIDAVEDGELPPDRATWLCAVWNEDPRGAIERIARMWREAPSIRLIAQAAKHGDWTPVRARIGELRRALRRGVPPQPADVLARLAVLARRQVTPAGASVAFMGRESNLRREVLHAVAADLAPLGLTFYEGPRGDIPVVFDGPAQKGLTRDAIAVRSDKGVAAAVVDVERGILRWLECRVERRYPHALVGDNPFAARLLQFASRHGLPLVQTLLNSDIRCRLGSPVLMPYPFGIVIEAGASIGSRVTVMQQVSLLGAPVIEDNVTIGPGAKVIGALRVGRGATVGPNAIVTRDVPSHCTVVGNNHILGHDRVVVEKRRKDRRIVVNT